MTSKYTTFYSLSVVVLAHLGALVAVIYAPALVAPRAIEPPSFKNVIIASKLIAPSLTPPEPQKQKLLPTPETQIIPMPKAPASKRATWVKQNPPQLEPPVDQPTKPAEPSTAPVFPPYADANQFNNPAPVYPAQSRRLQESGVVLIDVLIKADGSIGEMRLKTSSGYSRLDDAAQRAVKTWHFVPAQRGGEAIDFWYELPVEFSLIR
jgi:protein TonB